MSIYKGEARRLDDVDLPRIGRKIGVGEDVLHAFIEVETRGTGFDKQGRVLILFEPHIFYRLLKGAKRQRAVELGLAYQSWGEKPYPRDSYPRLEAAMKVDEAAALMACSWGLGQVLGSNFKQVGYSSIYEMVQAFADDEENHLEAIVAFCKANKIDVAMRRLEAKLREGTPITPADCVPVVRPYNGTSYAKNRYHIRFAAALNRWRKIKDTPYAEETSVLEMAKAEEHIAQTAAVAPPTATGDSASDGPKEVAMTQVSKTTKGISLTLIVGAVVKFIQEMWNSSQEQVLNAGQYALAHLPQVILIVGLAALGIYIYNQAAKRREARLAKVLDIHADRALNDVIVR